MKSLRGVTTIEVMIMLIAMSLVILAAYGAKISALQAYRELIHRERAQLYAAETLEEFEALKLSLIQQDYVNSWDNFLGRIDERERYQMSSGNSLNNLNLVNVADDYIPPEDDSNSRRYYFQEEDQRGGYYTQLIRSIWIEPVDEDSRKVTIWIYWGVEDAYDPSALDSHPQTLQIQAVYADHTESAYAL